MTLYELTGAWKTLLEMAEDPEEDPQAIADTMDSLQGDIEDKADGYGKVMRSLRSDVTAIDEEIRRLQDRRATILGNIDECEFRLKSSMEEMGINKIKTKLFSFNIQKTPARVVIDREGEIPVDFLVMQSPKINKEKIKQALKAGDDSLNGIAHLEQGTSLRMR